MKTTHDWLPFNHEALYDQANQTWNYLLDAPNRDRMGFSPGAPQGHWLDMDFAPKFFSFTAAFDAWRDPATRTPIKTTRLEEAEKPFKESYRQLYTGFLKSSPLATDDDLVAMGLPKRNSGHTPVPAPTTFVESNVVLPGPATVEIHFHDAGSEHKAKPAGVHGAEIAWAILDTPPVNWDALTHSSFDTHTPLRLTFEGDQRGKTLYFALRWENTTGEKGPWNEIQSAIIP